MLVVFFESLTCLDHRCLGLNESASGLEVKLTRGEASFGARHHYGLRLKSLAVWLTMLIGSAITTQAQSIQPQREYVRLNGRVVAVEHASPPIRVDSLTPSQGGMSSQVLTASYTAPAGAQSIKWVEILIATDANNAGTNYCLVHYDAHANRFWLYKDGQSGFAGPIAPGTISADLQNAFCALKTFGSSAAVSGPSNKTLSVSADILFKGSGQFKGYARGYNDDNYDTGWIQKGTVYNISPELMQGMSLSPASGNSMSGIFSLTYTDQPGFSGPLISYGWDQFLIAVDPSGAGLPYCFVHYDRAANTLWLYSRDVGYFVGPVQTGTPSTLLSSSDCSVNTVAASKIWTGGGSLGYITVTVPVTMTSTMAGIKKTYMRTLDILGRDSGWKEKGGWTVPNTSPISVNVSPASVTVAHGRTQGFTASVSGTTDTAVTWSVATGQGSITSAGLYSAPVNPSGQVTATIRATSHADPSKYGEAAVLVPANSFPSALSVSPEYGSGNTLRTFAFAVADPDGATDITSMEFLFADAVNQSAPRRCHGIYFASTNTFRLWSDDDMTLLPSGVTSNYWCSVSGVAASNSGNVKTLSVGIAFSTAFGGDKVVRLNVEDSAGGNLEGPVGTWTVFNQAPSVITVNPASGSGNNAVFTFTASDPDGGADIGTMQFSISDASWTHQCHVQYDAQNAALFLYSDDGSSLIGPIYGGGVASNSYCTVSGTSAAINGNDRLLTSHVVFTAAFAGAKIVRLAASDRAGIQADYREVGEWIVP